MVGEALAVQTQDAYEKWSSSYAWKREDGSPSEHGEIWQEFVIRAVDERGAPIPDWYLELCTVDGGVFTTVDDFDLQVHAFSRDSSYRSFHVDVAELEKLGPQLGVRLSAKSGTDYIAYLGVLSQNLTTDGQATVTEGEEANAAGDESLMKYKWDAQLAFPALQQTKDDQSATLFYPFTTTLIEVVFNREPLPPEGTNKVLWFLDEDLKG
jgi:hypothetical protein